MQPNIKLDIKWIQRNAHKLERKKRNGKISKFGTSLTDGNQNQGILNLKYLYTL